MRLFSFVCALLLLPAFLACEEEDAPTPSRTPEITQSPPSEPTPEAGRQRTGTAPVDEVIDLLESGDLAAFRSRLNAFPERCSANPQGLGDPPRCEAGVPDGGTIETIRLLACHRSYPGEDDDNLLTGALPWLRELYAVFESSGADLFQFVPRGDFALVFTNEKGGSERYEVTADGRINGAWFSCGQAQAVLPKMLQDARVFLVSPRYPLPAPTPTPRPTSLGYPPGYGTGIAGVDSVAAAIASGNPDRVAAHFQLHPIGCIVDPVGFPSPPFCDDGMPAGTPVLVMPVGTCQSEGAYWQQFELAGLFENHGFEGHLFAAYRGSRSWYQDIPEPEFTLIFRREDGGGFEAHIRELSIIGVTRGSCGSAGDLARLVPVGQMVLPPP